MHIIATDKYEQDISTKAAKFQPKTPGCKKVAAKNYITGHAEKDVKSKMGGQGQYSDSADGNKF